jgi:transposase-like protein
MPIAETQAGIGIGQIDSLKIVVEQYHRAVKRQVQPILGLKSFRSGAVTLAGSELVPTIRRGQLLPTGKGGPAPQFYSLAG